MTSLVPFALAWLATGQLPTGVPPAGEGETGIRSESLEIDEKTGMWHAKGHAILKTTSIEIRADEMTFDPEEQRAIACGHVIFFQGTLVAFAEQADVRLETGEATLVEGTVLRKANVSSDALLKANTREEVERVGSTSMSATGRHLQRVGPDHFLVDGIAFTPCDCNPVKPSWRIKSLHADLIPGERALLTLPVIYVGNVPVLAFPWLYLPMSDRRTGLLFTIPGSARGSFFIQQPVFITMGRSYDMTLTPGYYFGGGDNLSVKGPRLQTEFEYAPSARIQPYGRATLDLVYDKQPQLDPLNPTITKTDPTTGNPITRGLRGAGSLRHFQDFGDGFFGRIDASLVSDGYFPQSLTADLTTRETGFTESTATVYRRRADNYVGLDVAVRQDLRFGYGFLDQATSPGDFPAHGPNPLQRLPELIVDVPEARLSRWLYGSLRIEYSRLAPLQGSTGIDPAAADPTVFPSGYDPSPLEARDRIDFRPRLSIPIELGRFARLTPYAWYRQDLYVGEVTGTTHARGYPLLGALLDTEISRSFPTKSGGWRHSIAPSVEVRYVPQVFGPVFKSNADTYDEIDRALTPSTTSFVHGVAQLSQKLVQTEGTAVRRFIGLDIGQGFDLQTGAAADAFARAMLVARPLNAAVVFRYDTRASRLAQFSANAGFDEGKGVAFSFQYDNLILAGPDNLRKGIDELVGPPATANASRQPFDRAQTLTAHVGIKFKFGLALSYDITVSPENDIRCQPSQDPNAPALPAFCSESPLPAPWTIRQQVVTLSINPSCDCWRLDVRGLFPRQYIIPGFQASSGPLIDFGITLTLARFGSFGLQ
jgi:LPS-assembly protein